MRGLLGLLILLTLSTPVIAREISPSIRKLAKQQTEICDTAEAPYCYLFKATVDIDDGYLRIWKRDLENRRYVVGTLQKGETVYVRDISKDGKRGYITVLTIDCMVLSCTGEIDLRYLR